MSRSVRQHAEKFTPESTVPSTVYDVKKLETRFNRLLYEQRALETGFCPIRRRLYDDLFTELIRIIRIECAEQGLLFQRIQDEILRWMNTYDELYVSSMAYSMRQYLYKAEEKKNYELAAKELETDCQQLVEQLNREKNRLQRVTQQLEQKTFLTEPHLLAMRKDVVALKAMRKRLKSDLQFTLNNLLSSPIFPDSSSTSNKKND